jgi:hypothetical protein
LGQEDDLHRAVLPASGFEVGSQAIVDFGGGLLGTLPSPFGNAFKLTRGATNPLVGPRGNAMTDLLVKLRVGLTQLFARSACEGGALAGGQVLLDPELQGANERGERFGHPGLDLSGDTGRPGPGEQHQPDQNPQGSSCGDLPHAPAPAGLISGETGGASTS